MEDTKKKQGRKPKLFEALICFFFIIIAISATYRLKAGMEMPLMLGVAVSIIFAFYLRYSWSDIQSGIISGVNNALICFCILLLAGMLVGIWIIGGTVPSIIYYGLQVISPGIFLPFTFILCSIVSLATGTSFGSIATVGLALFGVGQGLGIPTPITVGAIASGAFLGDKISPLSDTSVAAASMCDVNIFDHVKSTIYTSIPAAIITFIIYTVLGLQYASGTLDIANITLITTTLDANFNISLLAFLPPIIIIVLSIFKVPSLLALGSGVVISAIFAIFMQGVDLGAIFSAATKGYTSNTGVAMIDKILSRGGMNMMASTIIMIFAATAMGGVLTKSQVLSTILESLLKVVKKSSQLITLSVFSGYIAQLIAPTMMFGIVMIGKTLTPAYKKLNVDPKVLSRTLGDTITLGNVLIPWGGASLYLQGVLSVDASYIPYTFLSILSPIIAILFALTGFGVWKLSKQESDTK